MEIKQNKYKSHKLWTDCYNLHAVGEGQCETCKHYKKNTTKWWNKPCCYCGEPDEETCKTMCYWKKK